MSKIIQIKERLSVFKNLYDSIRIVDPRDKKIILVENNPNKKCENISNLIWKRYDLCEKCISMKAFKENDTFVKIENVENKIFLVTATPIEVDGVIYIVEILKDVTLSFENYSISTIKNDAEDLIKGTDKNIAMSKQSLTGDNYGSGKADRLNKLIDELRTMLNDVCSFHDEEGAPEKLILSRCLDELIVQYMTTLK